MLNQVGIHYIGFSVNYPSASTHHFIYNGVRDNGVRLAGSLGSYANAEGKLRAFYAFDPDDILVKFDEGTTNG